MSEGDKGLKDELLLMLFDGVEPFCDETCVLVAPSTCFPTVWFTAGHQEDGPA